MANPQVIVEFIAKVDDLKKGFAEVDAASKSTGDKLKGFAKTAIHVAGAAGLAVLVGSLKLGVDEFTATAKVTAQTEAVLKSTGEAANVTAQHVEALAHSLQEKSGVDHNAIQSGENLLLTFRDIRNETGKGNDVFDQATKAMLDMSVALGENTTSAAMQLGKALNDPIKGVTALRRVGVQFTDAQKKQIKAMVDAGDTMGAQKVILQELQKEFGGSAQAAGKTLPGQLSILKDNFKELTAQGVKVLIPPLQAVAKLFADNPGLAKAVTIGILALAAAMVTLNVALAVTAVIAAPVVLIVIGITAAVAALVVGLVLLVTHFNEVVNWLTDHWVIFALIAGPFIVLPVEIAKHWTEIENVVKDGVNAVVDWVTGKFDAMFNAAWNLAKGIKDGLFAGLEGIGQAAWDIINNIGDKIANAFSTIFNWGWSLGAQIINGLQTGLAGIATAAWSIISGIAGPIFGAFSTIFNWGWNVGAQIINGIQSGLAGVANAVWSIISGIATFIAGKGSAVFNWGWNLARQIVDGIVAGIKGVGTMIFDAIKAPINAVIGAWNSMKIGAFTINLPSPLPDVHFGGIGLPNLPYLAQGGIVTGPTLAMIGEQGPEAVIPLGQSGAPVQVRVFIGDRELTSMIRTEVITENNRTAQTLLAGLA
jgi:hypothetical protein